MPLDIDGAGRSRSLACLPTARGTVAPTRGQVPGGVLLRTSTGPLQSQYPKPCPPKFSGGLGVQGPSCERISGPGGLRLGQVSGSKFLTRLRLAGLQGGLQGLPAQPLKSGGLGSASKDGLFGKGTYLAEDAAKIDQYLKQDLEWRSNKPDHELYEVRVKHATYVCIQDLQRTQMKRCCC